MIDNKNIDLNKINWYAENLRIIPRWFLLCYNNIIKKKISNNYFENFWNNIKNNIIIIFSHAHKELYSNEEKYYGFKYQINDIIDFTKISKININMILKPNLFISTDFRLINLKFPKINKLIVNNNYEIKIKNSLKYKYNIWIN